MTMTGNELLDAPLGTYGTTLREIISAWAEEFTGKPDEAIADIENGLRALIPD